MEHFCTLFVFDETLLRPVDGR